MANIHNSLPYLVIKSARPKQWAKNLALYAALLFSGFFFYVPVDGMPYAVTVTIAFILFCALTSSVYFINDIIDREADRHHPFKKNRPIASGKLPVPIAATFATILLLFSLIGALWLMPFFFWICLAYLVLQIAYVLWLKEVLIFDVLTIALGFLLRIYAGSVVVNLHMSVWFLLTVISASLFLAVAKRQSELTLVTTHPDMLGTTRKTLVRYSQRLLDQYTAMFATATWLTYAIFTFEHQVPNQADFFGSLYNVLPKTWHSQKLLMLTIPFVIFGVMRYLQLVYENNRGESPEKVLFTDKPIIIDVMAFGGLLMVILYVLQ